MCVFMLMCSWSQRNYFFRKNTQIRLTNLNKRRNWAQRLQKRVIFFPKWKKPKIASTSNASFVSIPGSSIFLTTRPILLKALFLIRFDLNLKRVIRKKDKTLRRYWITTRVLFNLSRQSKGARMGKGKGKNLQSLQLLTPFTKFILFTGVRPGRILFFLNFFNSRFTAPLFLSQHWINFFSPTQFVNFRPA